MTQLNPYQMQDVVIDAGDASLPGILILPEGTGSVVVFAHGSGSSRFSPRNQQVARYLNDEGFGTLLFDLLTAEENEIDQITREHRFDIPLLAERLEATVDWFGRQQGLRGMKLGMFGASTGAAAALIAAAKRSEFVDAVVSRGGRPDLAGSALAMVEAPTLLIVGGWDDEVITLNEQAAAQLKCEHKIQIVPDATHLFEEPGKLEEVSRLVAQWFKQYLMPDQGEAK